MRFYKLSFPILLSLGTILALGGVLFTAQMTKGAQWDWVAGSGDSTYVSATSQSTISVSWDEGYYAMDTEVLYRCAGGSCSPSYYTSVIGSSSFGDSGLSCGTTYGYNVCSDYGCSYTGYATTDACTPSTPSTPSASGSGQTTMSVSWGAVSGASGYYVYRNGDYIGSTGSTSYGDSGLSCGTQYGYSLVAYVTTNGRTYYSGTSGTGYGTTDACPSVPTAPSGVTATPTSQTNLTVAWTDNSGNENGFKVYSGDGGTLRATVGPNNTSAEIGGLSCATSYDKWGVIAYNGVGDSAIAFNTPPSTLDACTPSAPSALSCSPASQSQVNCSWTDNSNNPTTNYETGFQVERCSGSGCSNFSLVGSPGQNVTSFSSTGLTAGTLYGHRVRAYVTTNGRTYYSGYTAVSDATTDTATPGAPTSVSETATSQSTVTLNWAGGSPGTQTGFRMSDAQGTQDFGASTFSATGVCSTAGPTISCGTSCNTVSVAAYVDTNGRRYYSSYVYPTPVTLDACTPATPTGVSASAVSANQVNVSWGDVTGETGYKVENCAGVSCSNFSQISAPATPSYSHTGLSEVTTQRYQIKSYVTTNGRTYDSAASTIASATTQDLTVAVTTYPSYVNASNQSAITVAGTCGGGSGTVSVTVSSSGGGTPVAASPTCSSGTWSATPLNLSGLGEGTITYSASFSVSPNTATDSKTGTKDVTAPAVGTPTDGGSVTNSASVTFSSSPTDTGGSGLSDCTGQIDVNNTDGAGLAYNGSVGTDGDHTFTGSSGNTYYYRLYCSDAAGNSSSYTSWTDGILVDASAPSCSTASNSGNENTAVTLTASCSDTGGSGISSYAWYSNAACTTSAGSGSTLNAGTQTEPAAVTYYYKATDGAGNSSNCAVATSTWSNVAPTANNITGSANEGSAVTLTPNASDPGGTTMSYTWYSDSGCSSQITTGSTYNAPAQTDGTSITYYYKAFDAQGLGSTQCASAAATWNNVNPVVSALISPADGVWATSREFCATVTDTGGGTVTGKFVIGGSTYTGAAVSSGSNSCYTHTADLNGTSWYAYATDANSANSANSGTRAAYVDITAPTPSPSTGSAVSTCAYDGLSRSIDWTISASTDVTSGLHSSGYSFTNGATWQASNVLSESGQSLSELTKTVKARDVAGNQTTAGVITAGAVSCVAPPSSAPASPAGTLDGGQGLASLSWSTVSNASGYLIEESTDGGSTYLVIGDNTSNTLNTLTRSKYGQPCPKDYYYRVIAYTVDPSYDNDANCPAGYKTDRKCSAPSSVITAKIRYCTGLFLTE